MCHHHMAFRRCGEPIIVYICPQRRCGILEQRVTARVVPHGRGVARYREEYMEISPHVCFDGGIPERIGRETDVDLTEPCPGDEGTQRRRIRQGKGFQDRSAYPSAHMPLQGLEQRHIEGLPVQ